MGMKGRAGWHYRRAHGRTARCNSPHALILLVTTVLLSAAFGVAGAHSLKIQPVAKAGPAGLKPDALCNSGRAFPDANQRTIGNTTYLNRQLSVYEVLCTDFGKASEALPKGDVFCTLLAAAIGVKFEKDELYVDGACASKAIATHEDPAGIACGGLVTLVGAVTDLAPELKGYAVAAGVACDVGHSLGNWIETQQEAQAAKAVWRRGKNALKPGKCLKFVTHGFPRGDDWLATPCSPGDRGFADLPVSNSQVNKCGDINSGLHDVTARNVSCVAARRFIARYERCHGSSCEIFEGYRCSYRSIVAGVSDEFRCSMGVRVIRWRVGP